MMCFIGSNKVLNVSCIIPNTWVLSLSIPDIYTWYLPGINGYLKPDIFRYFFYKRMNLLLNSIQIKLNLLYRLIAIRH